jgi:rhodanese-related sulfurtransferase
MSNTRQVKDALFEQVARIAKALASPKRLELISLLCQAPQSVDTLAREAGISIKLASAHLKALRISRLVETERQGKQVIYRLASSEVPHLWVAMRNLAQARLFELQDALAQLAGSNGEWLSENRDELLRKARAGELVIIDVRPTNEYVQAHLPFARSLPLAELGRRLLELPKDKPIIAYCRGGFCLMSGDAVRLLHEHGYEAMQLRDGVIEWGMAQLSNPASTPEEGEAS